MTLNKRKTAILTTSMITAMLTSVVLVSSVGTASAIEISFNLGEGDTNRFSDLLEYEVEDFQITNASSLICPSGDCTFELDDAEFRENSAQYAYVIEGLLRVTNEIPEGTESYNYELWGSLDRTRTLTQSNGAVNETISGEIRIDPSQAAMNFDPMVSLWVSGSVLTGSEDGDDNVQVMGFDSTLLESILEDLPENPSVD